MDLPNNNQNKQMNSVNTRGVQFYNAGSILFPSTLVVGGWNGMITLKIHPAKDKTQQTASSVYDYDKSIQTAINGEQAIMLSKGITTKIIPSLETKENCTIGVIVGGYNMVLISNGINKGCNPFIAIYKEINESFVPEQKIYYEFNNNELIENYEEIKSENIVKSIIPSELLYFNQVLIEYSKSFSNAIVHSFRVVDKSSRDRQYEINKALASQLGIQFSSNYNSNRRSTGSSPFNNVSNESKGKNELQVENVETLDSLDGFMS